MRNKKLLNILILFFSLSMFSNTIEVGKYLKIKTIKEAVSFASNNDTILVNKGVYFETNLVISKPLVLKGIDYPIIDGRLKEDIFIINSDNVTITGLQIINVGRDFANRNSAIRILKVKNFKIINNQFKNVLYAINLEKASFGNIVNNQIIGNAQNENNSGNGIHLWNCNHILIKNNKVTNHRDGIYLEFSNNIQVINNISTKNLRYGLHFMFSNDNSYLQNKFINNGAGVAVMFSKRIKMRNNLFQRNWGTASYGLLLKEIYDAEIINNVFEENTIAVNVEGSNRILYSKNNFIRNGWALKVRGACYNNVFEKNNYMYNSFDVSWNTSMNDNKFESNYWSDYTGYDLDKNGVGDVPYRPVKLFSYIVNKAPETIILLRSLFINLVDFSEKVTPIFTPDFLLDNKPQMKPYL